MADASPEAGSPDDTAAPPPPGDASLHLGPGDPDWGETLRRYMAETPSPRRAELHRTTDALRSILHRLHGSAAPAEELAVVADELEALVARLEAFPARSLYEGFSEATLAAADPHAFFDHSPMLGRANPLAPPVTMALAPEGDKMVGEATFGPAYEGPPGCVHGGYVAAAFDEVLGSTQSMAGRPGMTGRLTIHYRSPTPLNTPLRFTGWVSDVSGRKTFTEGTVHAGDRLCAEAEGLFIAIDFDKMRSLREARELRFSGDA